MFVTLFYAILEQERKRLRFVNAGHNPPLLFRRGEERPLELKSKGLAIGIRQNIDLREAFMDFQPGDTLVMYTYGGDANLDGKINIDDYIKIGIGRAAKYYYGKSIRDLDSDEMIRLVTILSSPVKYNPDNFTKLRILRLRYQYLCAVFSGARDTNKAVSQELNSDAVSQDVPDEIGPDTPPEPAADPDVTSQPQE